MEAACEMKFAEMLDLMMEDKQCFDLILQQLPQDILGLIESPEFEEDCKNKFMELDQDLNGVLSSDELQPQVKELIRVRVTDERVRVTDDQCQRLLSVWDSDRNGVLSLAEWVDYAKYVAAYALVEAEAQRLEEGGIDEDAYWREVREKEQQPSILSEKTRLQSESNSRLEAQQRKEEEDAAIRIQSIKRGKAARAEVAALKDERIKQQKEEEHAALRIQSIKRGKAARAEVAALKDERIKQQKEEENAAIRIQSIKRGKVARAEVAALKDQQRRDSGSTEQKLSADSALVNAQAQINCLTNEMAFLSKQIHENAPEMELEVSGTGMSQTSEFPSPEAENPAGHSAIIVNCLQDMQHLKLDLDFANSKVKELTEEKRELLQVQSRMQAQIRTLQQQSEESEQKLQHQELDMRSMMHSESLSAEPSLLLSGGASQILEGDPSMLEGVPQGLEKMTRAQAISALQLLHHELHKERQAREKAELRSQKCVERLHKLVSTVERQRDDMSIMEKRCKAMESIAGDRERRLQEGLQQADSLRSLLKNLHEEPAGGFLRGSTKPRAKPQRAPGAAQGGPLTRQRSAPHTLPVVRRMSELQVRK